MQEPRKGNMIFPDAPCMGGSCDPRFSVCRAQRKNFPTGHVVKAHGPCYSLHLVSFPCRREQVGIIGGSSSLLNDGWFQIIVLVHLVWGSLERERESEAIQT